MMPPYEIPRTCQIDYRQIMQAGAAHSGDDLIAWMKEDLVYAAFDAYVAMTDRQPEVVRITQGSFEYIYDDCASLEALELPTPHLPPEKRLVLAIGRSAPRLPKRDDSRLRGWSGPTLKDAYGPGWDRGHFIAYTLGGVVDGFELNVFVQRRSLNRGWKSHPRGRLYREMEDFCAANMGTFCFSRPIYSDETAKPAAIEFALLKPGGDLRVEVFDNR